MTGPKVAAAWPTTSRLVTDRSPTTLGDDATATFSPDRNYRYTLTRHWDSTRPMAVWVMCNPSTADAFAVDPTIRRCVSFSRAWGAGGLLVMNLFALRSTNPKALYAHTDPVGPDNDDVITEWLSAAATAGPVIAAWGAHGQHQGRAEQVLGLLAAHGVQPLCLGVTKGGYPRHPLYVPGSAAPFEYPSPAAVTA